jgi:hypothetical protein
MIDIEEFLPSPQRGEGKGEGEYYSTSPLCSLQGESLQDEPLSIKWKGGLGGEVLRRQVKNSCFLQENLVE